MDELNPTVREQEIYEEMAEHHRDGREADAYNRL